MSQDIHDIETVKSEDFSVIIGSKIENDDVETVVLTSEEKADAWLGKALDRFDPSNRQYSVYLNDDNSNSRNLKFEDLTKLAHNAQSNLTNILQINSIIRDYINEDDIIGRVYEALTANLNSNIRLSFNDLPRDYDKEIKNEVKEILKHFHRDINVNQLMETSIPTVYSEGNCIRYLRSKNKHYVVDTYPLGVALISDYSVNSIPYVLIDIRELTNRLQKTVIKGKKNKPLFFDNLTEEIKNNYPPEIYKAYINKEHYAKLDLRRSGVNRYCNLNRKYGLSPIFKALKPALMLKLLDKTDAINTKAKAKKIIHQILRKEAMGQNYAKKGFEFMAYAHENLMLAMMNNTVVYTSPPQVEKLVYVEPSVDTSDTSKASECRARITSALGISFLNTDGNQTVSTANISLKQLMKTINKIAEQEEIILKRWYEIVLGEHGIPMEYCPTPHILDAELLEFDMKKQLSELLYSKFGASYETAFELIGIDIDDEIERRKHENDNDYDEIFTPHKTSYNSSGSSSDEDNDAGRTKGTTNGDNTVNETKIEYDEQYNEEVRNG